MVNEVGVRHPVEGEGKNVCEGWGLGSGSREEMPCLKLVEARANLWRISSPWNEQVPRRHLFVGEKMSWQCLKRPQVRFLCGNHIVFPDPVTVLGSSYLRGLFWMDGNGHDGGEGNVHESVVNAFFRSQRRAMTPETHCRTQKSAIWSAWESWGHGQLASN